jgi:hypothetical protein
MYYRFDYRGLEANFIEEYVTDVLVSVERRRETIDKIINVFKNNFTFDMLQSTIEEMNRFDCDISEAVKWLNIDVRDNKYEANIFKNKKFIRSIEPNSLDYFDVSIQNEFVLFEDKNCKFDTVKNSLVYISNCKKYTAEVQITSSNKNSRNMFMDAF